MTRNAGTTGTLRWLVVLASGLLAAAALTAAANGVAPRQSGPPRPPQPGSGPGVFFARYHLCGYGVYHRTTYFDYKAAPCQTGGKGGGTDGLRYDGTIRWETVRPGLATVTRVTGAEPAMELGLSPGAPVPGIVATVTVTYAHTYNLESVVCHLDGSEERLAKPDTNKCGSHSYSRGYLALPIWPNVATTKPGERFAFGLRRLPSMEAKVQADWSSCGPAVFEFQDEAFVNGRLPFASLPKRLRGKVSAIAHGGETVLDSTSTQNGIAGSSVHDYDAYNATDYVTFVRVG